MEHVEKRQRIRPPQPRATGLRLLFALSAGILWGLLLGALYTHGLPFDLVGTIFLIPLALGIVAPFAANWRSKPLFLRSFLIGAAAWLGMSIVLLVWAAQLEAAYAASCQLPSAPSECARGEGWTTLGALFYLASALVLLFLMTLLTVLVIVVVRKLQRRGSR